jgi:hypothetical protein
VAVAEPALAAEPPPRRPLAVFLDAEPGPGLAVTTDLARRFRHALDVVLAYDPHAVTACFTSAYGRSPVRSGSYLALGPVRRTNGEQTGKRDEEPGSAEESARRRESDLALGELPPPLRRFSPPEVLRLLGFPATFRLPPELPRAAAWHLAGNSLALPAARAMLAVLPPLAGRLPAAEEPGPPAR